MSFWRTTAACIAKATIFMAISDETVTLSSLMVITFEICCKRREPGTKDASAVGALDRPQPLKTYPLHPYDPSEGLYDPVTLGRIAYFTWGCHSELLCPATSSPQVPPFQSVLLELVLACCAAKAGVSSPKIQFIPGSKSGLKVTMF